MDIIKKNKDKLSINSALDGKKDRSRGRWREKNKYIVKIYVQSFISELYDTILWIPYGLKDG